MARLNEWIAGYGALGPAIYVMLWLVTCLLFLPGVPMAILGGVAFGPVWGAVYASVGSTAGATLAFLVARYVARETVESWAEGNAHFKKIDEGVERRGWRILMVTRLIPFFPFNLQNFAYGLTRISLPVYTTVSWVCMLPSSIFLAFTGGALAGRVDLIKTLAVLAIAAAIIVLASLTTNWIKKRELLRGDSREKMNQTDEHCPDAPAPELEKN